MAVRRPIARVAGRNQQLPEGDLLLGGGLVKTSVDASIKSTVPTGYQHLVWQSFQIEGSLQIDGTLVVL